MNRSLKFLAFITLSTTLTTTPWVTNAEGLPPDATPFCALRFGFRYTEPDKWPEMRAALKKNIGTFDEVWFSTGVSFPPLAWHEKAARQCANAAADLRQLGIVPSIEIQTIIGHTDGILEEGDCSGRDWGTWVGADGTAARHVSCPHDPRLAAYFARVGELHAAWRPGSMWIDDDVTLRNRAPMPDPSKALPGCFCARCLDGFSQRDKTAWTRPELTAAIRANPATARRWKDYQAENFAALVRTVATAVHRISPQTVFGYQYGATGHRAIVKGIFDGCGHPVRLRPGGGAYWDTYPHDQLVKAYELQELSAMMGREDWIGARCPEIETCPRTFSCRTPKGIILEAFENLALGMDFLSMFIADARTDETTAFYANRLFPRLKAAIPFLKEYRDANRGTLPCGLDAGEAATGLLTARLGIPIVNGFGRSLGELPPIESIRVRTNGSGTGLTGAAYRTRVLQVASSTGLMDFAKRADEASSGRLPVRFDEPTFAFALPRTKADGTLVTLAIVNASIDRQDPVDIRLRGVPRQAVKAVWHQLESNPTELALTRCDDSVRVTLPTIGAWDCGYLSFR